MEQIQEIQRLVEIQRLPEIVRLLSIRYFRGIPFSPHFLFKPEVLESAMQYRAKDGDVVLFTYPKTGSTWLLYIIWGILHKGEFFDELNDSQTVIVPFIEMVGTQAAESLHPPRFYRHHLPYHMLNINEKAKYLYIHRNPADTVISYYHFVQQYFDYEIDFDLFFDAFLDGNVGYGDYFDHVLSAYYHGYDENVLLVSYEEMTEHPYRVLLEIAIFLGFDYYEFLQQNELIIGKILQQTGFAAMKKNLKFTLPGEPDKEMEFFRKGVVGDGKNKLSHNQKQRLNEKIKQKMSGTEFESIWLV